MATMKSTVKYYSATRIADLIAGKAFEHLIDPIEAQIQSIVRPLIEKEDLPKLAKMGFINVGIDGDNNLPINVYPDSYTIADDEEIATKYVGDYHTYRVINLHDDATYEALQPLAAALKELEGQKQRMREAIRIQVEGRTVKKVCEAWPEAADIVCKVMEVDKTTAMTAPLEALLARFLPALPAPVES